MMAMEARGVICPMTMNASTDHVMYLDTAQTPSEVFSVLVTKDTKETDFTAKVGPKK